LGRQESRGTLGRQASRGQMRRQQSSNKVVERDTYTPSKADWKNSLRGSSQTNGKADSEAREGRKNSRSHSVQHRNGNHNETGTRRLLDPGQARRSRSKSVTGRSRTRSPSPNPRLFASTHSSRAKTSDAYQGATTLPRRSSKSAQSPTRYQPTPDTPAYTSDMTHRNPAPTSTRRSASPGGRNEAGEGDPFVINYRSFDEFRGNKKDSFKSGPNRKYEASPSNLPSPPRKVSSPPRQFSSPPRNISSPPKVSSYSGFESQSYSARKTSNSSSGSGSGLYSDSGFGSYSGTGAHSGSAAYSGSSSGTYSGRKSPAYSSLDSSQSYGRSIAESSVMTQSYQDTSSRKYQEQKRSSSPVKISLGALKIATINPWDGKSEDDNNPGYGERRSARNSGVFSYQS